MTVATKLGEAMDIVVLVVIKQGAKGRVTEEGQGEPHMNKRSWCRLLTKSNESRCKLEEPVGSYQYSGGGYR